MLYLVTWEMSYSSSKDCRCRYKQENLEEKLFLHQLHFRIYKNNVNKIDLLRKINNINTSVLYSTCVIQSGSRATYRLRKSHVRLTQLACRKSYSVFRLQIRLTVKGFTNDLLHRGVS
jgi:hypothetical protein